MTKVRRTRDRKDAPADVTAAAPQAPAPAPQRSPLVSERVWNRLTILVVVLILVAGTWRNFWQNGNTEQYRLLLIGRTLSQGGALYTQAPYDGRALSPACDDACTQRLAHLLLTYTKAAEIRYYDVYVRPTDRMDDEQSP